MATRYCGVSDAPAHGSPLTANVALSLVAGFAGTGHAQVTAFVGARLIIGDGRDPVENATLIVDGSRLAFAGASAAARVPDGARRVTLAGKTVMPMLIDTHVHMGTNREALTRDLMQRAYWGVNAAISLGTDAFDLLDMRGQVISGAARYLSAGRGITRWRTWFSPG